MNWPLEKMLLVAPPPLPPGTNGVQPFESFTLLLPIFER